MFWNKLKYKNIMQSGRSMVEIIGVLAVVGVLSIGAVSGYKYGMNRYRANETINELKIRALGLMQQINRGEIVELKIEMGDKTSLGYTTDAWIKETNPKYFYISLENVSPAICEQILEERWTIPTAIYVGNTTYTGETTSICGNDTYAPPMDFEFYADFAEGIEYVEEKEDEDEEEIEKELVQQGCDDPSTPLGDLQGNCHACTTKSNIEVGKTGQCSELCPNRRKNSRGYCTIACPSATPLRDSSGNCHACDTTEDVWVGSNGEDCVEICSNRQLIQGSCRIKCTSDKPLMADRSFICYSCDTTTEVNVGNGLCSELCPNRVKGSNGYCYLGCPSDTPLQDKWGGCHLCDTPSRIEIDGKPCTEVCPNRIKASYYKCAMPCPADEPLMDESGWCYACDTTSSILVANGVDCTEVCPNRDYLNGRCLLCGTDKPLISTYYGSCYACDTTSEVKLGPNDKCTEVCPNRKLTSYGTCIIETTCGQGEYADKPLQKKDGTCYSCDTPSAVEVGPLGKCESVCPNRKMTYGGYCAIPCTADQPLMNYYGSSCYACDTSTGVYVGYDGQCSEICPNRQKDASGHCRIACPSSTPLMDRNGYNCYACDSTTKIEVGTNGPCTEICPNRQKIANYCYFPCPTNKPLNVSGTCYACSSTSSLYVGSGPCEEVCPNKRRTSNGYCYNACPSNTPLMNNNGSCYACDYTNSVYVGETGQCESICPNRKKSPDNRSCVLPCSSGKPLISTNGTCYSCDTTNYVNVGKKGKCNEVCPNRSKTVNGYCVPSCGIGTYQNRPLMHATEGVCYSCSTKDPVYVGDGECEEVCANRTKREDGYCYLNEEGE